MSNILLSIVTINYNNYLGLKKTVDSVLSQQFKNIEFIVIDGGSNDGSKEYLNSISKNLSYWISERDQGIFDAMNKGFLRVKGKYVLFLNSGDWLVDDLILQKIHYYFLESFDLLIFTLKYGLISKTILSNIGFYNSLFNGRVIPHQSTFFKSDLIKNINGYNIFFKIAGDHHLYSKLFKNKNLSIFYSEIIVAEMSLGGVGSKLNFRHLIERLIIEIIYIKNMKTAKSLIATYFKNAFQ